MHEALIHASRLGPFKKKITAFEIKSREHYRELFPLISPGSREPVTWVKGIFDNGELKRRSHFRLLPGKRGENFLSYKQYSRHRASSIQSDEHKEAKSKLLEALSRRITASQPMYWSFKYEDISDFYFKGNILFNATCVAEEHKIATSFDKEFCLDIAVLGRGIDNEQIVLFGAEIEKGHMFDGLKAVLCKTLGFPLITVDISGMSLDDINFEWAETALTLTTQDDKVGFRKNFIYLPPLLYPFYIRHENIRLNIDEKHSYIIFVNSLIINEIEKYLVTVRDRLSYNEKSISIAIVNGEKSPEALHQVRLAGEVIGVGWEQLNSKQYLRVSVPRPIEKEGRSRLHKFYLLLTKVLLSNDALVGYKYTTGKMTSQLTSADDIWIVYQFFPGEKKRPIAYRYLPKLLASPILETSRNLGLF